MKSKLKKRLLSAACAFTMMISSVGSAIMPFKAYAEGTKSVSVSESSAEAEVSTDGEDEELCHKNIELHPNGEQAEEVITLDGMMPEEATAKAVDVSAEHEGAVAYDITINDGGEEYQPDSENPIRVEISDPRISGDSGIELWHIHDDGTREQINEFTLSEGSITFSAEGFSVYEIVEAKGGAEPVKDPVKDLTNIGGDRAKAGGLVLYYNNDSYFTSDVNSNGALVETTDISAAAVWYITPDGTSGNYKIYTKIDGKDHYIHTNSGYEIELSETQADTFTITKVDSKEAFYLKKSTENKWLQHSGKGNGIRYWTDKNNAANSQIKMYYADKAIVTDDPAGLDGKTYGLFYYKAGDTMGNALMGEGDSHSLVKLVLSAKGNDRVLYVDQDNEIDRWKFTDNKDGTYTVSCTKDSGTVYLCEDGDEIAVTSNASDAGKFKVETNSASKKIRLSLNDKNIIFSEGKFGYSTDKTDNTWLNLLEPAKLDDETDLITFSADRVSVSDIKNGQKVIIYIRIWNEEALRYDIYAVDHRGGLYPCYASGGKIMWLGDGTGSLEWDFTEYYDEVTKQPNYYYELYNPYSEKYIAPQLSSGQVLSDEPVGINMQGRRNGDFYSDILAWENSRYAYIGLRPNAAKTALEPCSQSTCFPFYFATLEDLNLTDRLHTVPTVDNNEYGIKMKMVNFGYTGNPKDYGNADLATVTNEYFAGSTGKLIKGMLSTDLKADGYPEIMVPGSKNRKFSEIYADAQTVNHLFLERVYNSSGYFEFDSCQNFATLKKTDSVGRAVKGSDGKTVFNTNGDGEVDFTVFRELGTHDRGSGKTLQHGQFFPYDTIDPSIYSVKTNQYDSLQNKLKDNDPRKYEALHKIQTEEVKEADYYFGMELEASFVQTPSGLDAWGHDIVFEFTGDDDFWLYVDNELVLDLGGTHSALMGKVNFRTGEVTFDNNTSVSTHGTMATKTLREIFAENYRKRKPSATDDEVNAFLAEHFDNGETVFSDYSQHTMKIFYMERGGNASNLYMHFNLAAVTPGHVVLSKEIEGPGKDFIDLDFVEYPFQIYYKEQTDTGELSEEKLLANDHDHIRVTYQNSNLPVTFVEKYRPPGVSDENAYHNVYFINPSKKAEISFPDNTMQYRLVECAVDTSVYSKVLINGKPVPEEYIEYNESNRELVSYSSILDEADKAPTISFSNYVNKDVIKDLYVTKQLRDEDGNIITDDDATFSFRLYLSTVEVPVDELALANMYNYYVLKDGIIFKRDHATESFVTTGLQYSRDNIDKIKNGEITGLDVDDVIFRTSGFGAISGIPSGYTICVSNLPVGTMFKITEDDKTGYGLDCYEQVLGDKVIDGVDQKLPSYYKYDGEEENVGRVISDFDPRMNVVNKKGYSLTAKKKWSDLDITTAHDPIYTAVYADGVLVEGSVKQIKSPSTQAYYFWETLKPNADATPRTSLDGYEVREVKISSASPTVAKDGTVTNYGTVTPLASGEEQRLSATRTASATPAGEEREAEYDYVVSYSKGEDAGSSRTDTVINNRKGGIAVKLFKWKTYDPLKSGTFKLKDSTGKLLGTYTSDGEGIVTMMYSFEHNKKYTLTQTVAPKGYVGLQKPVCFAVNDDETISLYYADGTVWGTSTTGDGEYDKDWVKYRKGENGITAFVDVFNKPFNFKIDKTDSKDSSIKLGSAHFALFKQANTSISGYVKNHDPMTGFEDMVTVNGAVDICGGSSGRVINPGPNGSVYFLTETQAPFNYTKLTEDIIFRISPVGIPSIVSDAYNGELTQTEDSYIYTLSVPNTKENKQLKTLTIEKQVMGTFGNRSKEFDFTVEISGADASEEGFVWAKNGETQADKMPAAGTTFTMKHGDRVEIVLKPGLEIKVSENSTIYTSVFKLGSDDPVAGDSITFTFTDDQTLLVTNTLDGEVATGLTSTVTASAALVIFPMLSMGAILYCKRRRKEE